MNHGNRKIIWWTPPIAIALCLVLGMSIGALTNIVNVRVCSYYYRVLLGWWSWDEGRVRVAAIFQGMLEGGALGLLFGIVLAIAATASTALRCPVSLAVGMALRVVPIALLCWILGGIAGFAWANVTPRSVQHLIVDLNGYFPAKSPDLPRSDG